MARISESLIDESKDLHVFAFGSVCADVPTFFDSGAIAVLPTYPTFYYPVTTVFMSMNNHLYKNDNANENENRRPQMTQHTHHKYFIF